jgi:hypothetical protein
LAKIWIAKNEEPSDPNFLVQIVEPRWVREAAAALSDYKADRMKVQEFIDRISGVRAPEGTKLEVAGGWVDANDVVGTVDPKPYRANDIYRYGWTWKR